MRRLKFWQASDLTFTILLKKSYLILKVYLSILIQTIKLVCMELEMCVHRFVKRDMQ